MWRLMTTRTEGKVHGWTWWPWKRLAQLPSSTEHNWLMAWALPFWIHHHSPVQATLPKCCTKPVTLHNGLWIQTHTGRYRTFSMKYFGSRTPHQPVQTFLELRCGLIHFIHIALSFLLSFRNGIIAFPHCLCISLSFFLHRYFPNKSIAYCGGLYFNIQRYQVIILKSVSVPYLEKGVFEAVVSWGFLRWGAYPGLPRWALNAITNVLIRERGQARSDINTSRGNATARERFEAAGNGRCASSQQRLEGAGDRFSPRASRGSVVLPTARLQHRETGFGTSGLQNCRRIDVCCLKLLHLQ